MAAFDVPLDAGEEEDAPGGGIFQGGLALELEIMQGDGQGAVPEGGGLVEQFENRMENMGIHRVVQGMEMKIDFHGRHGFKEELKSTL